MPEFYTLPLSWYVVYQDSGNDSNIIPEFSIDVSGYENPTGYGDIQVKDLTATTIVCGAIEYPTGFTTDIVFDGTTLPFNFGDGNIANWLLYGGISAFDYKIVQYDGGSGYWWVSIVDEFDVEIWQGRKYGGNRPAGTYYPLIEYYSGTMEVTNIA